MILMYYNENELPAILTFAEAVEYLYMGNRWRIKKEDLLEFMNTDRA